MSGASKRTFLPKEMAQALLQIAKHGPPSLPSHSSPTSEIGVVYDEGKVVQNKELVAQTPIMITKNGEYDTTLHNLARVSVNSIIDPRILFGEAIESVSFQPPAVRRAEILEMNFPQATELPEAAFTACLYMSDFVFPKCQSVGSYAFFSCLCSGVAYFPECERIEMYAFRECQGLTTAFFPKCSYMGTDAFASCYALRSVYFPECTNAYFYECGGLETVVLPKCKTVGWEGFRGCANLKTVYLGECSEIYENAFRGCDLLQSVYLLGSSVVECRSYSTNQADPYIVNTATIYVPESLYSAYLSDNHWGHWGSRGHILSYQNDLPDAFFGFSFPFSYSANSSTYLQFQSFYGCDVSPDIGNERFPGGERFVANAQLDFAAWSVTDLAIPEIKTTGVFANCEKLSRAYFPDANFINSKAFQHCSQLSDISFPVCKYIGTDAFGYCEALESATFPVCKFVDVNAFFSCSALAKIDLPKCIRVCDGVFMQCESLKEAKLPACVEIEGAAFYRCSALTKADCPKCIAVGYSAFRECSALTEVLLPNCARIGEAAFTSCTALTVLSFPACTMISQYAFTGCQALQSLYLTGSFVTGLTADDFYATPIMSLVSTITDENNNVIKKIYAGSIYVPAGLYDQYVQTYPDLSWQFVGVEFDNSEEEEEEDAN